MHGQITKFRPDLGIGVITADDGRKFRFSQAEVLSEADGLIGSSADFVLVARSAKDIVLMTASPWSAFASRARN